MIPKKLVNLTDDNWGDYLPFDYPESLIAGQAIPSDGIDPEASSSPGYLRGSRSRAVNLPTPGTK